MHLHIRYPVYSLHACTQLPPIGLALSIYCDNFELALNKCMWQQAAIDFFNKGLDISHLDIAPNYVSCLAYIYSECLTVYANSPAGLEG